MTAPVQHFDLKPGIYYDVSEASYHADLLCDRPTLSRSEAMVLLDKSPLHCWAKHPRLGAQGQKKVTPAMDFGSGAHSLALGKGADIVTVDADDWKTKAARAERDAIREQGKTPMLLGTFEDANQTVGAMFARLKEFNLYDRFQAAKSEVVLLWDEGDNCSCRVMADKLLIDEEKGTAEFFDIKFTESAQPKWLPKHFADMGYGLQDQWYIHGLEQVLPKYSGRMSFTFILQETDFPYVMVPVRLGGEFRGASISKVMRAVQTWSKCMETNRWPGYTQEIIELEAPPWLLASEMGAKAL